MGKIGDKKMADTTEIAKKIATAGLGLTIGATVLTKYGLNFTMGLTKCFLGGAENLAEQMVGKGLKLGIGTYLLGQTEKVVNWGFDKLIAGQKALKGHMK